MDEASDALPSLSRAFVRALSFIGTGISSSELSFMVEYCCGWEVLLDSLGSGGAAAVYRGLDSLRLRAGREVGRRKACRADVRRPSEVK